MGKQRHNQGTRKAAGRPRSKSARGKRDGSPEDNWSVPQANYRHAGAITR